MWGPIRREIEGTSDIIKRVYGTPSGWLGWVVKVGDLYSQSWFRPNEVRRAVALTACDLPWCMLWSPWVTSDELLTGMADNSMSGL